VVVGSTESTAAVDRPGRCSCSLAAVRTLSGSFLSFSVAALSAAALLGACGSLESPNAPHTASGGSGGTGGTGGSGGSGGSSSEITWSACPDDYLDECASVEMPINWLKPEGEKIPVLAARKLAKSGAGKRQLWLLQGGPGGSGNVFKGFVEAYADAMPDVDFYVLEHRGVGESTRLGCPEQESPSSAEGANIAASEWPACIEALKSTWGERLSAFTTSNDAQDLQRFIELTREADKKVFIFGASYGTTRALRFLQWFPESADGVILDSVVSPGVQFLSRFDEQYDPVGIKISEMCAEDEVCGQKLGDDPWVRVINLKAQLAAGHCAGLGLTDDVLSSLLPAFIQLRVLRAHLFPIVYRVERCAEEDLPVLAHYFGALNQIFAGESGPMRDSKALQTHVALSEMWEEPAPTAAELEARCDARTACPGFGPSLGPLYDIWPRYQTDLYANKWPQTNVPVLAMNGTLDPQTPIETAVATANHLTAPHQTFVTVPYSPHGVFVESPVKTPGALPCGLQMMNGFLENPEAEIDQSCLEDLVPVSFTLAEEEADFFFGTQDIWENTPAALAGGASQAPAAKPDWKALEAAARRATRRIGQP